MSSRFAVDAYAWVEYLDGTSRGIKLRTLIEENAELYTSAVTLAEVVSKAARTGGDGKRADSIMRGNSTVVDADAQLSYDTGVLHAEIRRTVRDFGLADAYVLATARRVGGKVLTGDPHFRDLPEAIMI
jgi:predicted nucleic acid-binding protein